MTSLEHKKYLEDEAMKRKVDNTKTEQFTDLETISKNDLLKIESEEFINEENSQS